MSLRSEILNKEVRDVLQQEPSMPQAGASVEDLVTRRCEYCEGSGEVDVGEVASVFETCPVCEGNCEVRVPNDYTRCRRCDGTGREDVGGILELFEPCERCHGTGWAPPPPVYR